MESSINKHLGQKSQYESRYNPNLLVAEPRITNRKTVGLSNDDLPFVGYDIWNAYEVSALMNNGVPVTAVAKVVYSADSEFIVESKSIKLYFNSFNMEPLGNSVIEVIDELEKRAGQDLSDLLKTDVRVHLFLTQNAPYGQDSFPYFSDYKTLEDIVDVQGLTITDYSENPKLLQIEKTLKSPKKVAYHSALLKSNCKVTSQPDWGDVYIYIKSENVVSTESLLKYIISFRDECHFHEEICETMYKRLWDTLKPKELMVTCLYVRRGGIDINPTRASDITLLDPGLIDETELFAKTQRQ